MSSSVIGSSAGAVFQTLTSVIPELPPTFCIPKTSVSPVTSRLRTDITEASGFFQIEQAGAKHLYLCLDLIQVAPCFVPLEYHADGLCQTHRFLDVLSAYRRKGCSGTTEANRILVGLIGHFQRFSPRIQRLSQVGLCAVKCLTVVCFCHGNRSLTDAN